MTEVPLVSEAVAVGTGWIATYTGLRFQALDPQPCNVDIRDIAHALSNICRFTGHTREFYSSGQHGVMVSYNCDPPDAMWGLLHDASDGYLADLASPTKHSSEMACFREVEANIMQAILSKFGLGPSMPPSVHAADMVVLVTESRDMMKYPPDLPACLASVEPLRQVIEPWDPKSAEVEFLRRFEELGGLA